MGGKKRRRDKFYLFGHRKAEAKHRRESIFAERARVQRARLRKTLQLFNTVKPLVTTRVNELLNEARLKGVELGNLSKIIFRFTPGGHKKPYPPSQAQVNRAEYYARFLAIDEAVFERTGAHFFLPGDLDYYSYALSFVKGNPGRNKSKSRLAMAIQEIFEEEKDHFGRLLSQTMETQNQ